MLGSRYQKMWWVVWESVFVTRVDFWTKGKPRYHRQMCYVWKFSSELDHGKDAFIPGNSCLWPLAAKLLSWRLHGTMKRTNGLAWVQITALPLSNWVILNGSLICTISRMAIMIWASQNGKCSVPQTPMHVPVQVSLQKMWLLFSRLSFPWQLKSFQEMRIKETPVLKTVVGSEFPGCPVGATYGWL